MAAVGNLGAGIAFDRVGNTVYKTDIEDNTVRPNTLEGIVVTGTGQALRNRAYPSHTKESFTE